MSVEILDPVKAQSFMAAETNLFLLDVRTAEENAAARLPASKLIPIDQIQNRMQDLPRDKSLPILVYCAHGVRSQAVAEYLVKLGYTKVANLRGGIAQWAALGLPFERGK